MTSSPPFEPTIPSRETADRQQNFACPVCRAKQPEQPECRRCNADLALYVKSLRSLEHSRQQLASANNQGDIQTAAHTSAYLIWLTRNVQVQQKSGFCSTQIG